MKKQTQTAVIAGVIMLLVGGIIVAAFVMKQKNSSTMQSANSDTQTARMSTWEFSGSEWQATDNVPACPDPLRINAPVDVQAVSAILYPGQVRGGNYKPHGGFRFDGKKNSDIIVKAPLDATLVKGSRYIEQGEVQYFFVFMNPCGIMYRFDHLLTLAPRFQEIANALPEPKQDDSRTTNISPNVQVTTGELIATAVGFAQTRNVSVDFGVYDVRAKNAISHDEAWASQHSDDREFAPYGVCWLDLFSVTDAATVKSLPGGDQTSGKQSDYCK